MMVVQIEYWTMRSQGISFWLLDGWIQSLKMFVGTTLCDVWSDYKYLMVESNWINRLWVGFLSFEKEKARSISEVRSGTISI
jgi:hypothetical protein